MGKAELSQIPWSYDYYLDGTPVTAEEKKAYGADIDAWNSGRDPFASKFWASGDEGA
ncbi:hypothetical protein D3C76_1884080 [compost metagenome]